MQPFDVWLTVSDLHTIRDTDPTMVRVTAVGSSRVVELSFECEIRDVPAFGSQLKVTIHPAEG